MTLYNTKHKSVGG